MTRPATAVSAVAVPTTENADTSAPQSFGRSVARAALIGTGIAFPLIAISITALGRFAGLNLRDAFGLGVFAATWGGPGFGAMFGAIFAALRNAQVE